MPPEKFDKRTVDEMIRLIQANALMKLIDINRVKTKCPNCDTVMDSIPLANGVPTCPDCGAEVDMRTCEVK